LVEVKETPWLSYFGEPSIGVWESEVYRAVAFQDQQTIRLDIQRKDEQDGITWDELQRIKNECGFADKDAVEFYPAQSDVLNTANYRHLYIFENKLPLIRRQSQGNKS
jgi:hypothetical protein